MGLLKLLKKASKIDLTSGLFERPLSATEIARARRHLDFNRRRYFIDGSDIIVQTTEPTTSKINIRTTKTYNEKGKLVSKEIVYVDIKRGYIQGTERVTFNPDSFFSWIGRRR